MTDHESLHTPSNNSLHIIIEIHQESTLALFKTSECAANSTRDEMSSTKPPQTPLTPCFQESLSQPSTPTTPSSIASVSTVTDFTGISLDSRPAFSDSDQSSRNRDGGLLLNRRFKHLLRPLAPLLSIETGQPHPHFPKTLLHFHLLSQAELDNLAAFYHQRSPSDFSTQYPMPIVARWDSPPDANDTDIDPQPPELARLLGADPEVVSQLNCKRRRFGRFMGLQGMESADGDKEGTMREEMERWVQREIARREWRDREREAWRWKGC